VVARPLILMPCSGMKLDRPSPARDLYQGVMWQSLRSNQSVGASPHVVVLSAQHGFVDGSTVLEPYDRKLDESRAHELYYGPDPFLKSVRWPAGATRILIAGGGLYRHLMRAMVGALIAQGKLARSGLEISEVAGGIGMQRSQLGQFVRNPDSVPSPYAGYHQNGTPCLRQAWGLTVGDSVRTTGVYVGKAGPKDGVVEELFVGPGGPTVSVVFDDDRPPLANGKQRSPRHCRGAWVQVAFLKRTGRHAVVEQLSN
jgi:hypothetical protein